MSKIISLIIILFSFSSFSNELPTSLFGIELGKEIEQYLIDRKEFDKINKEIELGESELTTEVFAIRTNILIL